MTQNVNDDYSPDQCWLDGCADGELFWNFDPWQLEVTFYTFWRWEKCILYCTSFCSPGATGDALLMRCWSKLGEGYMPTLLAESQKPKINSMGKLRNMKFPSKTAKKKKKVCWFFLKIFFYIFLASF